MEWSFAADVSGKPVSLEIAAKYGIACYTGEAIEKMMIENLLQ
jgi:hypothetical protein